VARAVVVAGVVGIATEMKNRRGIALSNPRALVTKSGILTKLVWYSIGNYVELRITMNGKSRYHPKVSGL